MSKPKRVAVQGSGIAEGRLGRACSENGRSHSPAFSRRKWLLGGGLSAAASLLLPGGARAQFDIEPIELSFADQQRGADSVSYFLHWYSLLDVAESYGQRHGESQAGDLKSLESVSNYMLGSLNGRRNDVVWLAGITNERADAFQTSALRSIEQSPLRDDKKNELIEAFRKQELRRRLAESADKAPEVVDGIESELKKSIGISRIPRVPESPLRKAWLCIMLNSMISGALAASQWYLVGPLAQELKSNGC
jgi:hypothetical protein